MEKNEFQEYEEQLIDLSLNDLRSFLIENREQIDKQKFSLKTLELYVTAMCARQFRFFNKNYLEENNKYHTNLLECLKNFEIKMEKIDVVTDFSIYEIDVERKKINNTYRKIVSNLQKMINYINIEMLFSKPYESYGDHPHLCGVFADIAFLLDGENIELFEEALINLSVDSIAVLSFARKVPGANINKLEDKMIDLGDLNGLNSFLTQIKGTNKKKLCDEIIKIVKSDPIKFNELYDFDDLLDTIDLIDPEIVSHEYMEELYLELKDIIYNAEIEKSHVLTKK